MMIRLMAWNGGEIETLARFGNARIVRLTGGRIEIRGGDVRDRTEAREWASMFCHEALPGGVQASSPAILR